MLKIRHVAAIGALLAIGSPAFAQSEVGQGHVAGVISNLTATPAGLLVVMSGSTHPLNCVSPPGGWMLIKSEYQVMISLTMTNFYNGQKSFVIYTTPSSADYCQVSQVDPVE